MSEADDLEHRLAELAKERESILERLQKLRVQESKVEYGTEPSPHSGPMRGMPALAAMPDTPAQKLELFLKLFRCRESVFPKLWENKNKGTKGYSPACSNEWKSGLCGKPPHGKIKCSECRNQAFLTLDEAAAQAHLQGQATIGTYAIRQDDRCVFLACDFDGKGWERDVLLYQSVARSIGVSALVERSRSGNGAHAWIFFSEPVQARHARTLGTIILSKCSEENYRINLASFDRLFPNQDYLPRGGFGNLIALPLQFAPREKGNSVFVDTDLNPFANQWKELSEARRLSSNELQDLINELLPKIPMTAPSDEDAALLADTQAIQAELKNEQPIYLPQGFSITIALGSQISIPLRDLPSRLIAQLKKTASFPNPEFYKLQRMRMQTYGTSRFVFSGELREDELLLPRGVLNKVMDVLEKPQVVLKIQDNSISGKRLSVKFSGTLTDIVTQRSRCSKKKRPAFSLHRPVSVKQSWHAR